MQPQWFYYLDGQPHGPVTLAEVRRLLKCDRLKPTDYVRYFQDVDWMPVSDFLSLLSRQEQADTLADEGDEECEPEVPKSPGVVGTMATRSGEWISESAFRVMSMIAGLWELLLRLPELRHSWYTVAALAIIGLAYAFKDVDFRRNETQKISDQLLAIEEELELLQGRNTSSGVWSDFQQASRDELSSLQRLLEDLARKSPRLRSHYWTEAGYRQSIARSHLIHACRTLKSMVDAKGGDDGLRAHFHRRLDQAHAQVTLGPATGQTQNGDWDFASTGIVVFDVLLVLGAAVWWIRRSPRLQMKH